jgi:hypothetical protein
VSDEDIAMPSLIREARGAYGLAIRRALSKIGLGDLPRNSAYVLGAMEVFGMSLDEVVHRRHKSLEQSHTVEALFRSGCLETRGAVTVLTAKGREAAKACAEARASLDAEVIARIGADGFATMRTGLVALINWKEAAERT